MLDDLSKLFVDLGNSIIREVTSEEVCSALIDIPAGKGSGPDGFNVEFYQFFWNEIGSHLVSAIKYFFLQLRYAVNLGENSYCSYSKK